MRAAVAFEAGKPRLMTKAKLPRIVDRYLETKFDIDPVMAFTDVNQEFDRMGVGTSRQETR